MAGLLLIATMSNLKAYELPVHGRVTNEVYKRSILSDPEFINRLGIENGKYPFGVTYYDFNISDRDVKEWTVDDFETEDRRMPINADPLSIEGWLMRGAIREDDFVAGLKFFICRVLEENPQGQDPYDNDPDRPLNHFFDPVCGIL